MNARGGGPVALALMLAAIVAPPAAAQEASTLGTLYEAAERRDARARQAALNETSLELSLRDAAAAWLPRIRVRGEARYQSDVPEIGARDGGAGGLAFPTVPRDRYEVATAVRQTLYDGSISAERGVARARTAEAQAHLDATLYALRAEVDAAYFTALTLAARAEETDLLIEDLAARHVEARARVRQGVLLEGEAAALEAELLRARQSRDEFTSGRRAALEVLEELTGLSADPDETLEGLEIPDLANEVAAADAALPAAGVGTGPHPAFAAFERTEERLSRESDLAARARLPVVEAFGEAGYGRPGLNQFGDAWDTYWLGGVRVEWAPWRWGEIDRREQQLDLRREAVRSETEAFADRLRRAVADERAEIVRLRAALESDERIAELRAVAERQARRRWEEGVLGASDYVDVRNDLLHASLAARLHRIEVAEARARYLSILGVPVP